MASRIELEIMTSAKLPMPMMVILLENLHVNSKDIHVEAGLLYWSWHVRILQCRRNMSIRGVDKATSRQDYMELGKRACGIWDCCSQWRIGGWGCLGNLASYIDCMTVCKYGLETLYGFMEKHLHYKFMKSLHKDVASEGRRITTGWYLHTGVKDQG